MRVILLYILIKTFICQSDFSKLESNIEYHKEEKSLKNYLQNET